MLTFQKFLEAKPPQLGTVFPYGAKIQFIDEERQKWITVAQCLDTPNAIAEALKKAKLEHPDKTLWVNSVINGRYIP